MGQHGRCILLLEPNMGASEGRTMDDATVTGRDSVPQPTAAWTSAASAASAAQIERAATADRTRLYFLDSSERWPSSW
jgi:hypothetical protein